MQDIYAICFLVKLPEVNQPENQQLRINNFEFAFIYARVPVHWTTNVQQTIY